MINSKIYKIEIEISNQLIISFDAVEANCERGVIYREKNLQKNEESLAYATLYTDIKKIVVRLNGIVFLTFDYINGDIDRFIGHYDVEFMGNNGSVNVFDITPEE